MEKTMFVYVCTLIHKEELNDRWLHPANSNVQGCHLSVVCQQVRVSLDLKHQERYDFWSHMLNSQM